MWMHSYKKYPYITYKFHIFWCCIKYVWVSLQIFFFFFTGESCLENAKLLLSLNKLLSNDLVFVTSIKVCFQSFSYKYHRLHYGRLALFINFDSRDTLLYFVMQSFVFHRSFSSFGFYINTKKLMFFL